MSLYPTYEDFAAALIAGTLPVDLNGINPNGWSQQATPLNKANLIADSTGSMLGIGSTGTVNSALAVLGQYNQYWWRRITAKGASARVTLFNMSGSGMSVQYSDSVVFDGNGFYLSEIKTLSIPYGSAASVLDTLTGKYFHVYTSGIGYKTYYCSGGSQRTGSGTTASPYVYSVNANLLTKGAESYTRANTSTAYPSPGMSGNYYYVPLGKPLEFFKEEHIVSFKYRGTNTYGANNPTILTFPFVPQAVIIVAEYGGNGTDGLRPSTNTPYWDNSAILTAGQSRVFVYGTNGGSAADRGAAIVEFDANTIKLTSTNSPIVQLNSANHVYYVTAFG